MAKEVTDVVQACADNLEAQPEGTLRAKLDEHRLVLAGVAADMAQNPNWGRDKVLQQIFEPDTPERYRQRMAVRLAAARVVERSRSVKLDTPADLIDAIDRDELRLHR